jgi:ribosomal-protein-alanine N-acetyltransferase
MPPTLETERLILRPINSGDFPSYQKNFNDYEVIRYLVAGVPWPYPENGVEDYHRNVIVPKQDKDYWHWGLFAKAQPNEAIGGIDLWRNSDIDNRGFWLARKNWGQGYMTEAATRINDHAFDDLGFEILYFGNAKSNIGSRKIKEKTGATYVGTRPIKCVDPDVTESEKWKLTKEDWLKFRGRR